MQKCKGVERKRGRGGGRGRFAQRETGSRLISSVIDSVLRHRLSHLLFNFQVAGGSLGWQVAGCARHVGREVVSHLPCLPFGGLALALFILATDAVIYSLQ